MAVLPILPNTDPFASMRIKTTWPLEPSLAATMVAVTFTNNCGPYRAQETARFVPDDAAALIGAGLAEAA
jgi:hypothetical protein